MKPEYQIAVLPGDGIGIEVMRAAESVLQALQSRTGVAMAMSYQKAGAQHLYLECPGLEHEFFIRRGRENLEKVFHFFNLVSRKTNVGPIPEATQ